MSSDNKRIRRAATLGAVLALGLVAGGTGTYVARSATAGEAPHAPLHTVTPNEATGSSAVPAPLAAFGPGLYLVGASIQPGEYETAGPTPGHICAWARFHDGVGVPYVIANGTSEGPTRVTAVKGEYLEISGCGFTRA